MGHRAGYRDGLRVEPLDGAAGREIDDTRVVAKEEAAGVGEEGEVSAGQDGELEVAGAIGDDGDVAVTGGEADLNAGGVERERGLGGRAGGPGDGPGDAGEDGIAAGGAEEFEAGVRLRANEAGALAGGGLVESALFVAARVDQVAAAGVEKRAAVTPIGKDGTNG